MPTTATLAPPVFKRILVATDFSVASRAAFQDAIKLCARFGSRLRILHVFEYTQIVAPDNGMQLPNLEPIREDAEQRLQGLGEEARKAGIPCEWDMRDGDPSLAILDAISGGDTDLVLLGTNAFHGFERLVFGSTAETVLRKATCPVMTVGPHARASAGKAQGDGPVVFATDFHRTTVGAIRFAEAVSKASNAALHCLHVLPRNLEDSNQNHVISQIMTEALQRVAADGGIAIEAPIYAITYGSEISNAVVEYARQHHARLIVLGVRQSSLLAAHFPAHIAYRIITEAPCPVLTLCFQSAQNAQKAMMAEPASNGAAAASALA
jgi:nucleotide-binding universal stress UspA family protein